MELGEKILSARDVTKRYISVDRGVIKAVNMVTFDVAKKEIFGIIGKSGAGKTTLSQIISGIIEPTSGEMNILIGDDWVDMTKPGIDQRGRAKEYIGLLHQEYDLFPHRTVHRQPDRFDRAGFPQRTGDQESDCHPPYGRVSRKRKQRRS